MFFTVFLLVGYFTGLIAMIFYYLVCHPIHTRHDVDSLTEDYPLTVVDGRPVYDEVG